VTSASVAHITFRIVIDGVLQRGAAIDLPRTPETGEVLREEGGKAYRVAGAKRLESGVRLLYLVTASDA
jgi:hypothetical protein